MGNQDGNCMGIKQFESLLHTSAHIKIKKDTVEYKNTSFGFNISQNKMTDDSSSCFDLTFISTTEDSKIVIFKDLLKEVRGICNRFNGNKNSCIIELYNSLGAYYCEKAYRIIYELENLMRKLIYKFMIVNVGVNWTKTDVPKEVNESIKKEYKQSEESFLHKLDFIQLSNLLFTKFSNNEIDDFFKSIKDMKDSDNLSVNELRKYQKKSNWEKFFAKKVKCEADHLEKIWKNIYDIRCQVAHCRVLTEKQFEDLIKWNEDVKPTIESALKTVDTIKIEESEREQVAEDLSSITNSYIANFLLIYNSFWSDVSKTFALGLKPVRVIISHLKHLNLINSEDLHRLSIIQDFRNQLVHSFGAYQIDPFRIKKYTDTLEELRQRILHSDNALHISNKESEG